MLLIINESFAKWLQIICVFYYIWCMTFVWVVICELSHSLDGIDRRFVRVLRFSLFRYKIIARPARSYNAAIKGQSDCQSDDAESRRRWENRRGGTSLWVFINIFSCGPSAKYVYLWFFMWVWFLVALHVLLFGSQVAPAGGMINHAFEVKENSFFCYAKYVFKC